MSLKVV